MLTRRALLCSTLALAARPAAAFDFPAVVPRPLEFPRDHGAHPEYRIEWWYRTGWLDAPGAASIGFQLTFFRTRTGIDEANPSAFAARQLLIAHAAIADPARGTLVHEERIGRAGFGAAGAAAADTDVQLDRWRFWRQADGSYRGLLQVAILLDELQEQVLRQVREFGNFDHLVDLQPEPGRTCRHDDAILGQKASSVIDQRGALHNQPVARAVQSLKILLLDALQRHEPHGWPVGSFENGFGINRIIFDPFTNGFTKRGWISCTAYP